jgi:hypothetical protein
MVNMSGVWLRIDASNKVTLPKHYIVFQNGMSSSAPAKGVFQFRGNLIQQESIIANEVDFIASNLPLASRLSRRQRTAARSDTLKLKSTLLRIGA